MDSHEQIAEEKIRAAMAAGEFDHLEGAGMPLNLDGYFATPGEWRMGLSILRSAEIVPEEIELLREIERLKEVVGGSDHEEQCTAERRKLAELTAAYEIRMERFRRRSPGPE